MEVGNEAEEVGGEAGLTRQREYWMCKDGPRTLW
jgi:hypothetical protein